MDLSNNNLTGEIPESLSSMTGLQILQLDNNELHGKIPSTLQQCTTITFLGLGRNKFSGEIPAWIGANLQFLSVMQLRSNMFGGYIPRELAQLARLQVLDLSHNNLEGIIPYSFGNFSAMRDTTNHFTSKNGTSFMPFDKITSFFIGLFTAIKGDQLYISKPLDGVKSIDLSGNNLSGQIPDEIGLLKGLINLNLSHNRLTKQIPDTIGNILSLEFLDLSLNELYGPIPQTLSDLTMLSHLNLSYNSLTGNIPSGRQLDTLMDPSIYTGNVYLCGPPIDRTCSEDGGTTVDTDDGNRGFEMPWLYVSVGLGFVFGFWCICGVLMFH